MAKILITAIAPSRINVNEQLVIQAQVNNTNGIDWLSSLTYQWSLIDGPIGLGLTSANLLTSADLNSAYLVIAPGSLPAGWSYTFQVEATDSHGRWGVGQTVVSVNMPPTGGRFFVSPSSALLEPNVTYHELRHVCILVAVTFKKFSCLTCQ